jgi:hypothetical protein
MQDSNERRNPNYFNPSVTAASRITCPSLLSPRNFSNNGYEQKTA